MDHTILMLAIQRNLSELRTLQSISDGVKDKVSTLSAAQGRVPVSQMKRNLDDLEALSKTIKSSDIES